MNQKAANVLAKKLYPLSFLQVIGGLVAVQTYADAAQDINEVPEGTDLSLIKKTIKRMPVTADVHFADGVECKSTPGSVYAMVPDGSVAGMCYFEDRGGRPITHHSGIYKFQSSLRFVVWMNTMLLNLDPVDVQASAVVKIFNQWGHQPINDGMISNMIIIQKTLVAQDARIFSAYTYDETKTQYLMLPYAYFAVDLELEYKVSQNCINPITVKDNIACT